MKEIDMRLLYTNVIVPLTPSKYIQKIIELTMTGSSDALDYINIIENDRGVISYLLRSANSMAKNKIHDPVHAIALLGVNKVRNTVLGLRLAQMSHTGKDYETDYVNAADYVFHAIEAEEKAIELNSSYPEIAFAGGFVFDLLYTKIRNYELKNIDNKELADPSFIINEVWKSGLITAITAAKLGSYFKLTHKKYLFSTGLVHNIGKIVLFAYDPLQYDNILTNMKNNNKRYSRAEYEEILFSHSSLGSLFLKRMSFLQLVEKAVDYHHDVNLLKHDDQDLYELASVINIAINIVSHMSAGKSREDFNAEKIKHEMDVLSCPEEVISSTVDYAYNHRI